MCNDSFTSYSLICKDEDLPCHFFDDMLALFRRQFANGVAFSFSYLNSLCY